MNNPDSLHERTLEFEGEIQRRSITSAFKFVYYSLAMQLALRRMESQGNLLVDSDYDEAFYTDLLSIETNGDRGEVPYETRSGNPATPKTSKHRLLESSALKTRIAVQDEKSRSWYVKDTFGDTKKENSVTKA